MAHLLRSDTIVRLEIFYFPEEMETLTRMTPESLEKHCWYRIGVQEFQWTPFRSDLISALAKLSLERAAYSPDCRWGCVFYDSKDERAMTMYFNRDGSVGLVNGAPVKGAGPLVELLGKRCSDLWEGKALYTPLSD